MLVAGMGRSVLRHTNQIQGNCLAGMRTTWLATHCRVARFLIQVSTKR
jgi:hypothetical protein